MSGGVHGRNIPNAVVIGLVAGALLEVATGSGEAFIVGNHCGRHRCFICLGR
jgi:hypothetical protein